MIYDFEQTKMGALCTGQVPLFSPVVFSNTTFCPSGDEIGGLRVRVKVIVEKISNFVKRFILTLTIDRFVLTVGDKKLNYWNLLKMNER